ncbi:MAG: type II toxin-antitoxin system VapC family toxin [Acidobacteria bacterium]|nr:type II toxin-antitoxin system VapC family toxin [Acidobacteriota bacterium]
MFLYLDTSALVKRYIAEAEAEDVDAVMNDSGAVGTSLITRTEVAAALARAVRQGRLNEDGGREAHRRFLEEWPDFGRVPVTDALAARADELTWTHALRAYDAMQLAAALACQETLEALQEDVLFACFDERLRAAAGETGLATWPEG